MSPNKDRVVVTGLHDDDWQQISVLKKRYGVSENAGLFRLALDFLWGLAVVSRGRDENSSVQRDKL